MSRHLTLYATPAGAFKAEYCQGAAAIPLRISKLDGLYAVRLLVFQSNIVAALHLCIQTAGCFLSEDASRLFVGMQEGNFTEIYLWRRPHLQKRALGDIRSLSMARA